MNERFNKLIKELSSELDKNTINFMMTKLNLEEQTTDIINLILSSYISPMFHHMKCITSEHEETNKSVKSFIKELSEFISKMHPIEKMEII